jgi:uncharacterized membrane protein
LILNSRLFRSIATLYVRVHVILILLVVVVVVVVIVVLVLVVLVVLLALLVLALVCTITVFAKVVDPEQSSVQINNNTVCVLIFSHISWL